MRNPRWRSARLAFGTAVLLAVVGSAPTASAADALGAIDTTFNAGGAGANGPVKDIAFGEDGTIYIAGDFTAYNGTPVGRIAALDADGTLIESFATNIGDGADKEIRFLDIDASGDIYVVGLFDNFSGSAREGMVRLDADGTVDPAFEAPRFVNTNLPSIAVRPSAFEEHEGNLYIGGAWDAHDPDGTADYVYPVVTLDATGALQPSGFTLYTSQSFQPTAPQGIRIAPDGDIVVYGRFGGPRTGIVKANPDGSFDETFLFAPDDPDNTGANNTVTDIEFVGDDILAVGNFSSFHGDASAAGIVRLLPDGSLDPSFDSPVDVGMPITTIDVDDDGRIYITGALDPDLFGGKSFGRLLPDGAPDTSFPATSVPAATVELGPDGGVHLFGAFTTFGDGSARNFERIVTDSGPAVPTGILVRPVTNGFLVEWTVPTDNVPDSYLAEAVPSLAGASEGFVSLARAGIVSCTAPHPQTSCTITGLEPETNYTIRLSSVRGDVVVTSSSTFGVYSGAAPTDTTNPTNPTNPGGATGTLPATGSNPSVLFLAAGAVLAGWFLHRFGRAD